MLLDKTKSMCRSGEGGCITYKCVLRTIIALEIIGAFLGYCSPMHEILGRILAAVFGATLVAALVVTSVIVMSHLKKMLPHDGDHSHHDHH